MRTARFAWLLLPLLLAAFVAAAWPVDVTVGAPADSTIGAKRELTTAEREDELMTKLTAYFDGIDYAGGTKVEVKGVWSEKASEIHKLLREYARYRFRHPEDPGPVPAKKAKK